MPPLTLISERFGRKGGIVAEGIERILGVQSLGNLELLVREAAQNSWDHRNHERVAAGHPVDFTVNLFEMTEAHRAALREAGIAQAPARSRVSEAFSDGKWAICISDRNCVGLQGPTRADTATEETTPTNYRDFVLDIGHSGAGDRGGTYGFGKSAYFTAGTARLIVVHSRCLAEQRVVDRFVAMALGGDFDDGAVRYTGRHWWGVPDSDDFEPLSESEEILQITAALGMPALGPSETGTSILIPGVDLGESGDSPEAMAQLIGTHLMANVWPLTVPDPSGCIGMRVNLLLRHAPVELTPAAESPELRPFVSCLAAIDERQPPPFAGLVEKERVVLSDGLHAGDFAYAYFPRTELDSNLEHSAALLRSPRLVTQYLKPRRARSLTTPELGLAAVFLASPAMNSFLAKAEPPGHNDWDPVRLPARSVPKRQITELMTWLTTRMGDLTLDHQPARYEPPGTTTTKLARQLGALLPVPGSTPPPPNPDPRGGGRTLVLGSFEIVDGDEEFVEIRQDFQILWQHRQVVIAASVYTATDDANRSTPLSVDDATRYEPSVVEWRMADGTCFGASTEITANRPPRGEADGTNTVVVRFARSTVLSLSLRARPAADRPSGEH
jgi:hypothetical protein